MNNQSIPAQRVRRAEALLKQRGGRRMPNGMLQPPAADALVELVAAGYASSPVAVITTALLDAQKNLKRTTKPRETT